MSASDVRTRGLGNEIQDFSGMFSRKYLGKKRKTFKN